VFIAIMTAKVEIPGSCLECDPWGNDSSGPNSFGMDGTYTGGCLEPKQLKATIYVSYYDAAQDVDRDGLPDCPCEEAVICVCYETCLKRVEPRAPCAESRSFVACLSPCADCNCPGTGRAFFRILEEEQKVCFVLTAKGIRNVRKACLEVSAKPGETGTCAVTLFPFPPETKGKDGDCDGLLSCGCFYLKDCLGPWKGRKMADIVKAMEEGCARVVVFTEECPQGALCGRIEDP